MQKIKNILSNNIGKHILPFLWIHGEDASVLQKEIQHIYDSGIRAICVEARPHNDFNGPKWFEDLGTILETCKALNMEMWLLDDSHFPTGYANGEVKKSFPHLQKKYLKLRTYDFYGPIEGSGACLKYAVSSGDEIVGIFLQKRTGFEEIDINHTIDVTDSLYEVDDYNTGKPLTDLLGNPIPGVHGKVPFVRFDLPEGQWSLNILTVSFKGGEKHTEGYLNPIVPEATDILLNTVYQPVYDHFKDEFGKTFQGFFSDEPRFGNIHGAEDASIGRNSEMVLPWRDDMLILLQEHCQNVGGSLNIIAENDITKYLPLLFIGSDKEAYAFRYAYMDLVSRLYSQNFDKRIADWCHAHQCEHIGHTIEDNEAAARLGYGAGHIFRAMEHADMAGIDVVIHQLLPGMDKGMFKGMHKPGWDGEFFTYLLGKFGGSLAHLDPKKQGRCMCELFGAYGWAEGNRLGKWMADYMLVRGVNKLVPHAFDCAPFPNGDCPPHFCGEGKNPQYPEFRLLMEYCGNLCELLNDGQAVPDIALFFNAEGEWSGDYQPTQKVAAVLSKGFVDYDLISGDYLRQTSVKDNRLCINHLEFRGLVFPWAEALPGNILEDALRIAKGGVPVWFVNALPGRVTEEKDDILQALCKQENVFVVNLENLVERILQSDCASLVLSNSSPYLRYYHYKHNDGHVYFFVNESGTETISTHVQGMVVGETYQYDAFENKLYQEKDSGNIILPPYGSKCIIVTEDKLDALESKGNHEVTQVVKLTDCEISTVPMELLADGKATVFPPGKKMENLQYVSAIPGFETFSGRIRYTFRYCAEKAEKCNVVLEGVQEGATVWVNDSCCGTKIVPDYTFVGNLKQGDNSVIVELNTTLARQMNDFLSAFMPMEPTGMKGIYLELLKE